MRWRVFKYASPFLIYIGALQAFLSTGWTVWIPLLYAFALVPLLELLLPPDARNLSEAEEELARNDHTYDYLLYAIVPLQFAALVAFLYSITREQPPLDLAGKTAVMGLLCGTFGINVGHELGHRHRRSEQLLAKALLLSSLYMHFFIEHNKGHHKRVATPEDPSSARYGEPLYLFFFRTIFGSYRSAWHLAARDAAKRGSRPFSLRNEMLQFQLVQLLLLALIFFLAGGKALLLFLAAATMGILLLETVNYIEHYGLERKPLGEGRWERALPVHSWNSNHVIGRIMLFELSRHSDHHYLASRKYQVLRHHEGAPQMPTGYPGMMLLSLLPPAWFHVMNRRVKEVRKEATERGRVELA
jgi:alkane 1-monooxygenase